MLRFVCFISFLICFSGFASFAHASEDDTVCWGIKDATQCRQTYENGTQCVWCLCKAVPSVCVNQQQAKKLPPGVYVCDNTTQIADNEKLSLGDLPFDPKEQYNIGMLMLRALVIHLEGKDIPANAPLASYACSFSPTNSPAACAHMFYFDVRLLADSVIWGSDLLRDGMRGLALSLRKLGFMCRSEKYLECSSKMLNAATLIDKSFISIDNPKILYVDGINVYPYLVEINRVFRNASYSDAGIAVGQLLDAIIL